MKELNEIQVKNFLKFALALMDKQNQWLIDGNNEESVKAANNTVHGIMLLLNDIIGVEEFIKTYANTPDEKHLFAIMLVSSNFVI
jgi:hypothetical protein